MLQPNRVMLNLLHNAICNWSNNTWSNEGPVTQILQNLLIQRFEGSFPNHSQKFIDHKLWSIIYVIKASFDTKLIEITKFEIRM